MALIMPGNLQGGLGLGRRWGGVEGGRSRARTGSHRASGAVKRLRETKEKVSIGKKFKEGTWPREQVNWIVRREKEDQACAWRGHKGKRVEVGTSLRGKRAQACDSVLSNEAAPFLPSAGGWLLETHPTPMSHHSRPCVPCRHRRTMTGQSYL